MRFRKAERFVLLSMIIFLFMTTNSIAYANSAYVVIDANSGRILDGQNENDALPIASLTKMWTALVAATYGNMDDQVIISQEASSQEGSSLYVKKNERYLLSDLLYGLMLRSGNDAAFAIAEQVGGSIPGFVYLMNETAMYYGLDHTYFTNPSGLPNDHHVSSAADTANMLRFAMKNEQLRPILTAKTYRTKQHIWSNKHKLLFQNEYAIAGKTGYTKQAGRTLATYFKKNDKEIIVVTLNYSNDWTFHEELANKIFQQYEMKSLYKKATYTIPSFGTFQLQQPIRLLLKKNDHFQSIVRIPTEDHPTTARLEIWMDHKLVTSTLIRWHEGDSY